MKKLLICLFSAIYLFSCREDPNNTQEKPSNPAYDMDVELVYSDFGKDLGKKSYLPFDNVYKFKFEGHRYIEFTGYRQCGIVHDPNCECQKDTSKIN